MPTKWPHDDTASKRAFYGDFRQKEWAALNLIRVYSPFKMYYDKKPVNGVLAHKKCATAFQAVFAEIWEKCGHDQKQVDKAGASDYAGCFNIRKIAGSDNWSNHSWACAIDLSASTNGFRYDNTTTLSKVVIDAFKNQGALWGGDYKGRKDPMHFEFVSR
jgi:hypothetical protein